MLESLIEHGGYSRNRKRISSRLGISGAALTQYIRQQNWPSFTRLLAIADFFDVSLDYLVYGQPTGSSRTDYGPLYRYFDHALADVQARGSRHNAVVTRIGRMLADRIDDVAGELAATPAAAREGLVQDDELLRLERYCHQCDLVSLNLEFDVIQAAGGLAPGRFLSVVAANLDNGARYRFILPQDRPLDDAVDAFRLFLADQIGGDRVRENCAFRLTSMPVLAGLLLYRLDIIRLEAEEPALHAQIRDYLSEDVWLGFVIRTNNDSNSDMLMDPEYVGRARRAFERMWSSGLAVLPAPARAISAKVLPGEGDAANVSPCGDSGREGGTSGRSSPTSGRRSHLACQGRYRDRSPASNCLGRSSRRDQGQPCPGGLAGYLAASHERQAQPVQDKTAPLSRRDI
jgi:transcriptional regulator with XRE-family HTH domain